MHSVFTLHKAGSVFQCIIFTRCVRGRGSQQCRAPGAAGGEELGGGARAALQPRQVSSTVHQTLARLILTLGARYKDALWLKMFLFIYKSDLPKKKYFFLATTG